MKKFSLIAILLVFSLFTCQVYATKYKILFLSTAKIHIGGVDCKVGDIFDDRSHIDWTSSDQCMRAKNMESKKQRLFTASEIKESNSNNLFDFLQNLYNMYVKNNHTSTRGIETVPMDELKDYLDDTFYLYEDIVVPTELPTDSTHYFRMSTDSVPETYVVLTSNEGAFTIDETSINSLIAHTLVDEISVTIEYVNDGEVLPITNSMLIIPFIKEEE